MIILTISLLIISILDLKNKNLSLLYARPQNFAKPNLRRMSIHSKARHVYFHSQTILAILTTRLRPYVYGTVVIVTSSFV